MPLPWMLNVIASARRSTTSLPASFLSPKSRYGCHWKPECSVFAFHLCAFFLSLAQPLARDHCQGKVSSGNFLPPLVRFSQVFSVGQGRASSCAAFLVTLNRIVSSGNCSVVFQGCRISASLFFIGLCGALTAHAQSQPARLILNCMFVQAKVSTGNFMPMRLRW